MDDRKKIGIIVVGDEILDGNIQDTNSNWLLKYLNKMNHVVKRIEILPDEIDLVSQGIRRFLKEKFEVLFVLGGIGPTPDDITVESVAVALEKPMVEDRDALEFIKSQYIKFHAMKIFKTPDIDNARGAKKMAVIPEGANIIKSNGVAPALYINYDDCLIFILPGVPMELKHIFRSEIKGKLLKKSSYKEFLAEVITITEEARLFPILTQMKNRFPHVRIGSYPSIEKMHVLLRIKGNEDDVKKVAQIITNESKNLGSG